MPLTKLMDLAGLRAVFAAEAAANPVLFGFWGTVGVD